MVNSYKSKQFIDVIYFGMDNLQLAVGNWQPAALQILNLHKKMIETNYQNMYILFFMNIFYLLNKKIT